VHSDYFGLAHLTVVPSSRQRRYKGCNFIQAWITPSTWAIKSPSNGKQFELNSEFDSLTTRSKSVLEALIRKSTKKKYSTYLNKWHRFCSEKKLGKNITAILLIFLVNFMTIIIPSVIKSAKLALSNEYACHHFHQLVTVIS